MPQIGSFVLTPAAGGGAADKVPVTYGTAAARPGSGSGNQAYFATDTGVLSQWDGSTWQTLATTNHDQLTGVSADDHHAQAHAIDGADHTASGLTAGQVLQALTATTFGFAGTPAHDHSATGDGGLLSGSRVDTFVEFDEQGSAPATPATGRVRVYMKADGNFYQKDDTGAEANLAATATGGAGAPIGAPYVTTANDPDLTAEQTLGALIGRGATGSKPAAGTAGRLYYDTTLSQLQRDNGTAWESIEGTAAGGAPTNATYVVTAADATLTGEKVLGDDVIMAGTAAARPAFGTAGRLYFETDTGLLKRDSGAAWAVIAAPTSAPYVTTAADANLTGESTLGSVIGRGATGSRPAAGVAGRLYYDTTISQLQRDTGSAWESVEGAAIPVSASVEFTIGGGVDVIATGVAGWVEVPFAATISAARLVAKESGSIVVDIWKDAYANLPATVADTITASAKPTLASAQKSQDTTLTGWTTAVAAGDWLYFNVDSVATVTQVALSLTLLRS